MINYTSTIKINFKGGIISSGKLLEILQVAASFKIPYCRFGLRQQLYIDVDVEIEQAFMHKLVEMQINFEVNEEKYPNITSSYPAEEIFITKNWLSEGVYKDVFDLFDYTPTLKINICDSNQSFAPILTGNINWVASPTVQHFWHVIIRFPKTNIIYQSKQLIYTNDLAIVSKAIENIIVQNADAYINVEVPNGDVLFSQLEGYHYIFKEATDTVKLPPFNLPYYEGLNKYDNRYWLGIYRRDELYAIDFLIDACNICLQSSNTQLCSTPWKSVIIKNIQEPQRKHWDNLLSKHNVNIRHAANELNFQVEDNSTDALKIKNHLINYFNKNDIRTFGICFGIKTKDKSEIFSSILIRKKWLVSFKKIKLFGYYNILCANQFNPNERTGFIFSKYNNKAVLPEQIRRCIVAFNNEKYKQQLQKNEQKKLAVENEIVKTKVTIQKNIYSCSLCYTIHEVSKNTTENWQQHFACSTCGSGSEMLQKVNSVTDVINQLEH